MSAPDVITLPVSVYPDSQIIVPDIGGNGQIGAEGAFGGVQNVDTFSGSERWRLEMSWNDLTGDDRLDMMGWTVKLRISRNVFLAPNFTASNRGVLTGTGLVVSTCGTLMRVGGLANGVSSWARMSDFLSVNSQLKMVTSDGGTDGSGFVTLNVWPPFPLTGPQSGALVITNVRSAMGGWRAQRVIPMTTNPPGYRTSLTVSAVERVNSSYLSSVS